MARCRIGYLLALAGALAFFLCFNGYFSFYMLVLALVFPLFSLAVSLPGMLGARVSFAVSSKRIRRGEAVTVSLCLESRARLPVARLTGRVVCPNLLTGDRAVLLRKGSGGAHRLTLAADVAESHCGLLRCEVTKLRVCDLLGIFSLRLPLPERLSVLSLPFNLPAEEVPALLGEGEGRLAMKPRPGGGPGEDYDLRPYRAGDPLRSVHWKLSSKVDGLVVRETLEPVRVQAVLTYDHFGPPDRLDAVFDRLDAVSRALIERERIHSIQWCDPVSGAVMSRAISSLKDLRAFQYAAFSIPAPATGRSILAGGVGGDSPAGLLRHLHLTGSGEEAEAV